MTTFCHTIDYAPVFPAQFSFETSEPESLPHAPLITRARFGPGFSLPPHYHPAQTETYDVHAGVLEISVDGHRHEVGPGDKCEIPPGVVHDLKVRGQEPVEVMNSLDPGLRGQEFLSATARLIDEGKITSLTGVRSGIYVALIFKEYRDVSVSARPPDFVIRLLARLGGVLGYRI